MPPLEPRIIRYEWVYDGNLVELDSGLFDEDLSEHLDYYLGNELYKKKDFPNHIIMGTMHNVVQFMNVDDDGGNYGELRCSGFFLEQDLIKIRKLAK